MAENRSQRRQLFRSVCVYTRPPLWSSGQSSWLQIQRSRFRFPALPDFLRSSKFGTGSTQPREDNWGATWKESRDWSRKPKLTAVGIRCATPRNTLYPLKLALTSTTSGGRSVGIVRWRTKASEVFFSSLYNFIFKILWKGPNLDMLYKPSNLIFLSS
jgi:hypothetical protein